MGLISKQAAIDVLEQCEPRCEGLDTYHIDIRDAEQRIRMLPSAQLSRLIKSVYGKTPEETYDFLRWLMSDYGMRYTDTRTAVIEWLRGEIDE